MDIVQKMKKALQRGRSDSLPPELDEAAYVLLPYVVQNQIKPVTDLLTNSTYNVNHQFGRARRTLLHAAANTGAFDSLMLLLKRGAIVNIQDKIGITALHLAARNGHKKCVQKLVEHGADISIHDNEGLTALHWLACNGRTELLVSILERGEFVDVVDIHGHTALHVSCQNGHYQCVVRLLGFNASLDRTNNEGRTPLFFACRHGQVKCVKLLLEKDASIVSDNSGVSPLDICAESGYKECVEAIVMKYPEQVNRLVWLVKQEALPMDKISGVLEYLCNSNMFIMATLISHLANVTATTGMELLSVSSDYQDLMPQFLRCVRVLCTLYPYYKQVYQADTPPLPTTRGSSFPRHAESVSVVESPREQRSRSFLSSWAGHRRANSHGTPLERPNDIESLQYSVSTGHLPELSDPLSVMEVVWSSLTSWFDLLMKEVSKLPEVIKVPEVPEGDSSTTTDLTITGSSTSLDSTQLAAAIILSAPPKRRQVYLNSSSSDTDFHRLDSSESFKRRSWHVERLVRVMTLEEEASSSLPSFHRSQSSEPSQTGDSPVIPDAKEDSYTPEADIVHAYADRLSAVVHAFSLCCNTYQKSLGRSGHLPRFLEFVNSYESVLKVLLARNPQLIFAHFHFLLESTELLKRFMHIVQVQPFEDRKKWFYENLYGGKPPDMSFSLQDQGHDIVVDRENIFTSSCTRISAVSPDMLKDALTIRFEGEAGIGAGVHREWFDNLSREILNPDYALFTQSADGATFQPNSNSDVNPDHLSYFRFAGRTMSLALYHKQLLNIYFTRSFYKHILGIPVSYQDVESIDPGYAKNLQWLLDNEIDDLDLGLNFSVETDVFGTTQVIELRPNGQQIPVTDSNKDDYVQLVTEMRMTQAIGPQINAFLEGFYELIPHHLISLFNEYELELLISGLPDIDPDDWEKNTEYTGYMEDDPVIKWFWELVHQYSSKDAAILLQFVTGSSRVPLGGFANLVGASGLTKFTISKMDYTPNKLPMASTCFNLLKLPEYTTKEELKERLHVALTCGGGVIDIT